MIEISKTQKKKIMHRIQEIGRQLIDLSPKLLARFSLDDSLYRAIMEAKTIKQHEAFRRQVQFIGRLMKNYDLAELEQTMASLYEKEVTECQQVNVIDQLFNQLRTQVLTLDDFINQYPQVDRQRIFQLVKKSQMFIDKEDHSIHKKLRQLLSEVVSAVHLTN